MEQKPVVTICNLAESPQTRWVAVPLPASLEVPDFFVIPGTAITGQKGRPVNRRVQHAYLRLSMDAGQVTRFEFQAEKAEPQHFRFWDSVLQNAAFAKFQASFHLPDGARTVDLLSGGSISTVHVSQSAIVAVARGKGFGFHWCLHLTLHSQSRILEWDLGVSWSDHDNEATKIRCQMLKLTSAFPLTVYLGQSRGWHREKPTSVFCNVGEWHDGVMIRASGMMRLPEQDAEYVLEAPDYEADMPFWATSYWPDFGPSGRVPALARIDFNEARAEFQRVSNRMETTPFARREFGQGLATGDAGSQWPFGAFKDATAHQNPYRAFILTHHTADDWCMRGYHHYEEDGLIWTAANHSGWITWDGQTHTTSREWMGKTQERPWGWNRMPNGRLAGSDDQHRGDLPAWWVAGMYGCYPVVVSRSHHLQTDAARAKLTNRELDAPRASGRLWQSWAWAIYLHGNDSIGQLGEQLAEFELFLREQQPDGWMWTVDSGNYIRGIQCAVPWHEALAVLGAWQCALLLQGTALGARFRTWAIRAAERLLLQAVAQNTGDGLLYPVNGLPATQPVDLTFPRVGVSFNPGTWPTTQVMVGSLGWWDWWSGVLAAGKESELARHVAERVWSQQFANGGGEGKIGWASLPGLY